MDFGFRNYDASLGRWMNIDPMAEKYYDLSSYNYTLNNPVFFIDPDGKEVDVTDLMDGGTNEDLWLLINLMRNLSDITGQNITTGPRNKKTGRVILMGDGCKECDTKSESAGGYLDYLLSSNSPTMTVMNNSRNDRLDSEGKPARLGGSQAYADGSIYLDAGQINNFEASINGAGLKGETMNTGFVFLHETLHTQAGASYYNSKSDNSEKTSYGTFRDPPRGSFAVVSSAGPVVKRVNKFRRELGLPERLTYSNSPRWR